MKKIIGIATLVLLLAGGVVAFFAYKYVFAPNVSLNSESENIQIPTGSNLTKVMSILDEKGILKNVNSFAKVANWMNYNDTKVQAGNYKIENNWSNRDLVTRLRSGKQEPVKITFNQCRTIYNLAERITQNIELDSSDFINYILDDNTLNSLGFNKDNVMTTFIPNTYEVYWNISVENLVNKMQKEYQAFWNTNNRREKLKALNLNESEVYTLASIVEKETLASSEKPTIAGLYLNRLRRGMKLEADPTVVFATGLFELKRILFKHLEYDSPFNTYQNIGLPPGPIFMPDISTIDATLSPQKHEYLFFCAKPDNSGKHAFATTNAAHEANARKFHAYLNSRKIR